MVLPAVPLICDVRLERGVDARRGVVVQRRVRRVDGDVVDDDADKGCVGGSLFPTDEEVGGVDGDELDDDVERWEAEVDVHFGRVGGESGLGFLRVEGVGGVVDEPERHFEWWSVEWRKW